MLTSAALIFIFSAMADAPMPAPLATEISVWVSEGEAGPGAVALDVASLEAALRLRVEPFGVTVTREQSPSDWRVEVASRGAHQLGVQVKSPSGELWCDVILSTRGRRPRDLVHTVALIAVETLTPVLPTDGRRPSPEPAPAARASSAGFFAASSPAASDSPPSSDVVVSIEPGRSPDAAGAVLGLRIAVAGSLASLLPQAGLSQGIQLVAAVSRDWLRIDLELAWWMRREYEGADFRAGLEPVLARLGAGAQKQWGPMLLSATVGPSVRMVTATATGEGVLFNQVQKWNAGGGARLCGQTGWSWFEVGLCGEAIAFLGWSRLVVDGDRVLDAGHTLVGVSVQVGYRPFPQTR